jgi:hypothetical protein
MGYSIYRVLTCDRNICYIIYGEDGRKPKPEKRTEDLLDEPEKRTEDLLNESEKRTEDSLDEPEKRAEDAPEEPEKRNHNQDNTGMSIDAWNLLKTPAIG